MVPVTFDSADIYIDSATTLKDKITRMDAIIVALEDAALKSATTGHLLEYWLDDGQTKIKSSYRSVNEIVKSIGGFQQLREMYINKLNGRTMRFVDGKNFNRQC